MTTFSRSKCTRWLAAGVLSVATLSAQLAWAGSVTIVLPSDKSRFANGPNLTLVQETCRECHSADYVTSQPRQSRTGWQNVVTKMLVKYGMDPISTTDQALIVDYLVSVYGVP